MTQVDAIIRPERLSEVQDRLASIGVEAVTVTEVKGCGQQDGYTDVYRGVEYTVDLVPKLLITIVASDRMADDIVNAILAGARSGKIGDGKILTTAIDEVIGIRTEARGESAI